MELKFSVSSTYVVVITSSSYIRSLVTSQRSAHTGGIYRYKRLNFGISSASEIFHETIRQVIQDITGARNISDDIVVYAENREKHDAALRKVLERLQESGLTLNAKKCIFRTNRISFFGVVFGENGISPDPSESQSCTRF